MAQATRIKSEDALSTLKALVPIFVGIGFFALILYILSIYDYQSKLNTYFVLNEDRNLLQNEYSQNFDDLVVVIASLKGKSNNDKLAILETTAELNSNLTRLTNQMIVNGYKMLELGIIEKEKYDLMTNDLNYLRLQYHMKIDEYIGNQQFAVNYMKIKSSTESCYNKIDLKSTNYARVVTALNKCSDQLAKQVDYINSSSFSSTTFKETSAYLNKYDSYWKLVKQMFTLLTKERDEQAKKVSEDVKKELKKLSSAQKSAQTELNVVLSRDIQREVKTIIEDINNKVREIEKLEETNSF